MSRFLTGRARNLAGSILSYKNAQPVYFYFFMLVVKKINAYKNAQLVYFYFFMLVVKKINADSKLALIR